MIACGSQRGLGQDLATHLLNAHDNERMEVAQVRGAIARDLHGAFAEWEIQADALTRCRNYLYSLSINPDPRQGELSREQYLDYIDRAEEKLGLSGQPRAVIFHTKNGRAHCHVVWSRIDVDQGKAIPMAFDYDKLMMVTRAFARDHGLTLPDGFFKDGKGPQLSLYELHQQRATGLTKEERMAEVTAAWRESDSAKAFVQALASRGYILASGKRPDDPGRSREAAWTEQPARRRRAGRPYVLVDLYGEMNALPKLIDDKTVRTKDIRAFLEKDYAPENLPTVAEAKALAAQHREALEGQREHEQQAAALAELKQRQADRRKKLEREQAGLRQSQHKQRVALAVRHKEARGAQKATYVIETSRIRRQRYERRPQGLAAFLGKVTGVELIRKKLHQYQDRRRYRAILQERDWLREQQRQERAELKRRHELQARDLDRKLRALARIEAREIRSLEQSLRAELRIHDRGGRARMPAIGPQAEREAAPEQPKTPERSRLAGELAKAVAGRKIALADEFKRVADEEQGGGDEAGGSEAPKPKAKRKARSKVERARRKRKRQQQERDQEQTPSRTRKPGPRPGRGR